MTVLDNSIYSKEEIIEHGKAMLDSINESIRQGIYTPSIIDNIDYLTYNLKIRLPSNYIMESLSDDYRTTETYHFFTGLGVTSPLGYIIIAPSVYDYIFSRFSYKGIIKEELMRFMLHHEYGHRRDLIGEKVVSPEKLPYVDARMLKQTKENEITADAYAIKDLDLTLEKYTDYREMLIQYTKKLRLKTDSNYIYDRKIPYELSKKL